MLAWLAGNAATIIISALLLAVVILLVRSVVRGKASCGGDCSACAGQNREKISGGCRSCPHGESCRRR